MNKKRARELVDNFRNKKELPPDEVIRLAVAEYESQIKYLAQQGIFELAFDPPKHRGAIRAQLEALEFVFEHRGNPPNKTWFITW